MQSNHFHNLQDPNIKASVPISFPEKMSLELVSFSDGKEAVAKAASFLYSKFQLKVGNMQCDTRERIFNELEVGNALKAVGWFSICICKIFCYHDMFAHKIY